MGRLRSSLSAARAAYRDTWVNATDYRSVPMRSAAQNSLSENYIPEAALQLAPVWGVVDFITRQVKGADCVYEERVGDRWRQVDEDLAPDWVQRPNNHQTFDDFLDTLTRSILVGGNGFVKIMDRDLSGYPRLVASIPTSYVSTNMNTSLYLQQLRGAVDQQGELIYYLNGEEYRPYTKYEPTGEIQHYKYSTRADLSWGESPLLVAAPPFRVGLAAEAHAELFFNTGGQPPALYFEKSSAMSETIFKEQVETFKQLRSDPMERHKAVFVSGDWGVLQNYISPEDMQLLQARSFTWRGACAAYGIPVAMVGGEDAAAWASSVYYLYRYTMTGAIVPTLKKISRGLTELTPARTRIRLEPRSISDPLEHSRLWERLVAMGAAKPSEARESLTDLPPDPTLDLLWEAAQNGDPERGGQSDSRRDPGVTNNLDDGPQSERQSVSEGRNASYGAFLRDSMLTAVANGEEGYTNTDG